MKVELINYTPSPVDICGLAAATCTNTTDHMRSLKHSVSAGHTSVLEHAVFTFKIEGISRVTLAQLTRHRIASFDVESQRYVRLDDPVIIMPESVRASELAEEAAQIVQDALDIYERLVKSGVPCEDARYVIPQAIGTNLVMTMNARELLHFFSLRCCNRAQWEIRQMADIMLRECREVAPEIFENAGPGCMRGHCPEAKPCGNPRTAI